MTGHGDALRESFLRDAQSFFVIVVLDWVNASSEIIGSSASTAYFFTDFSGSLHFQLSRSCEFFCAGKYWSTFRSFTVLSAEILTPSPFRFRFRVLEVASSFTLTSKTGSFLFHVLTLIGPRNAVEMRYSSPPSRTCRAISAMCSLRLHRGSNSVSEFGARTSSSVVSWSGSFSPSPFCSRCTDIVLLRCLVVVRRLIGL